MELGLSQEAFGQLLKVKEKVEEKTEKAIEDLQCEYFSRYFDLCGVRCMLSIRRLGMPASRTPP